MTNLKHLILAENSTLEQVLRAIDVHGKGFVFLGNGNQPLALITDGDVRRALLANKSLSAKAAEAANYNYKFSTTKAHPSEVANLLTKLKCVPIIDSKGELFDIATRGNVGAIPVYEPQLGLEEWKNLQECIDGGWISSGGNFVLEFEQLLGDFLGAPGRVLAVSNGTAALELCLRTLGIGPGDEVLVPDLTFLATANAVENVGALPVPLEVNFRSGLMDIPAAIEAVGKKTRAVIPVHLYGRPVDIDLLRAGIGKEGVQIIEDCAEAFGSSLRGKPLGTLGDAAAFSFFGNKNITTGEGGASVFRNKEKIPLAYAKRGHGFSPDSRRVSVTSGSNFRMTNMQAAIGVAQMTKVEEILRMKSKISSFYSQILEVDSSLILPTWQKGEGGVDWLYTVGIPDFSEDQIELLVQAMLNRGIEVRREFLPVSKQPNYRGERIENRNASERSRTFLCLPSSPNLTLEDVTKVANSLLEEIAHARV